MRVIEAKCGDIIPIGRIGENKATNVLFDVSKWNVPPGGSFSLLCQRKDDAAPYIRNTTFIDGRISWVVVSSDVAVVGHGKCELVYILNDTVIKSELFSTYTAEALIGGETPPDPWEDWVQLVLEAGRAAEEAKAEWENMTASAIHLPGGAEPTAEYSHGHLTIGIPKPTAETFTFQQPEASNEWTINHNLGKYPSVTIVTSGGAVVFGEVLYISENTIKILFSGAFSGTAYLN